MLFGKKNVKAKSSQIDMTDFFTNGLNLERNKKIKLRNDVNLTFQPGGNYLEKRKEYKKENNLYYKLPDGTNLFDHPQSEYKDKRYIYEIKLFDVRQLNIEVLSTLPNLNILRIQFSSLIITTSPQNSSFFVNLEYLDLSFNELISQIFDCLRNITSLKSINLTGNYIDINICNISNLENLEELNLSHNRLESSYISNDAAKNMALDDKDDKIDSNRALKEINIENKNIKVSNETPNEYSKNLSISNNLTEDAMDLNLFRELIYNNNLKSSNKSNSDNIKLNDAKINDEEINLEDLKKTRDTYNQVQKYFKTNIRDFFHNLSLLKKLKKLDLSNNKIHFFDINPFIIQNTNGFSSLTHFNISNNLIKEEIGILLVMNLPMIQSINFNGNPLIQDKKNFENIEFEIFKNKNILLESNSNICKEKKANSKGLFIGAIKPLKLDLSDTDKLLTKKNRPVTSDQKINIENNDIDEKNPFFSKTNTKLNDNKIEKSTGGFFITNQPQILKQKRKYINHEYNEFLKLAKTCLGDKKLYKDCLSIDKAYSKLRTMMNNLLTTDINNNFS